MAVIALLAIPAGAEFRDQAGALLMEQLSRPGVALSTGYVTELARRSEMAARDTRAALQALLDSVYSSQKNKTHWDSLVAGLRFDVDLADEKAGRFLREATKAARKAMASEGAYELARLLDSAASKAKISADVGKLILRRALNQGDQAVPEAAITDLPDKMGIRVTVQNEIRPSYASQITFFFRTEDDSFIRERFSRMHEGIITSLVEILPRMPSIKWAVSGSTSLLSPDVVLILTLDTFDLRGRGSVRDLPYATGSLMLQRADNGSVIMLESVEFISKSEARDHDIELSLFTGEIAEETTGILERFLGN